ncbi:related to tRNA dihydrouridine synthase [Cephalotrichum gorgonifer]|uniref:tRNA-dihydrouridine(16/17) synthase [NAD(P)(+)] n=1 Tax=Cephalotrichum gorgonifer TaxID=2041049 RepID=A0AAE8MTX6_9PEZI|nr:related to tRNA dihydrouridine synthase [Cephalotrichum gorgonifer]
MKPMVLASGLTPCALAASLARRQDSEGPSCSREALLEAADAYVAAQTDGSLDALSGFLAEEWVYQQDNEVIDADSGVLATTALTIDHRRTIADVVECASYTELISTGGGGAPPYVIGTQIRHDGVGADSELKITMIDSVASTTNSWVFNAAKTLDYVLGEDWFEIPEGSRDDRDVIRAAGDAYLDIWSNATAAAAVPWGVPCARLEGSAYTGRGTPQDSCEVGIPSNHNQAPNSNRRYVVDEVFGSVSILCVWEHMMNAADSHEFRLEGGKLRQQIFLSRQTLSHSCNNPQRRGDPANITALAIVAFASRSPGHLRSLATGLRRLYSSMASTTAAAAVGASPEKEGNGKGKKLFGREFYESIGSPKHIVAPMVDQSEFAWRMLSRSYLPPSAQSTLLAYTPMLHARLFAENEKYRQTNFHAEKKKPSSSAETQAETEVETETEPWLDGNPSLDRPLFVQFCANDPAYLLEAAKKVAPFCDAVDLNLGCPQGIARKGHYGAFLQEDQALIYKLINTLHRELDVPVTAKIRVLETKEATLAYARNVLAAGASILTVHGRRREQKGHLTGLADWEAIRHLRDNLPPETVLFANGNVLQHGDLERVAAATGADAVMSAEGNLSDPALFAPPPPPDDATTGREYWRGRDGRGGWRVDGVMRRYLDILHRHVAGTEPPARRPLFVPGDDATWLDEADAADAAEREAGEEGPARKKRKKADKKRDAASNVNYAAMQPHMFHLLRHFVTEHTDVRDALARSTKGDLEAYEAVLSLVERKVARGLLAYEADDAAAQQQQSEEEKKVQEGEEQEVEESAGAERGLEDEMKGDSSAAALRRCKRPWWVAQPIIRPLPKEALAKGSVKLSKKTIHAMGAAGEEAAREAEAEAESESSSADRKDGGVNDKTMIENKATLNTTRSSPAHDPATYPPAEVTGSSSAILTGKEIGKQIGKGIERGTGREIGREYGKETGCTDGLLARGLLQRRRVLAWGLATCWRTSPDAAFSLAVESPSEKET